MSGDKHLSQGAGSVKYFDDEVSPFVGFHQDYDIGFEDLYEQLPAGRKILYATPGLVKEPAGWQLLAEIKGLQFVFSGKKAEADNLVKIVALRTEHISEMMSLAGTHKAWSFWFAYHRIRPLPWRFRGRKVGCDDGPAFTCSKLYRDQCGVYTSRSFGKRVCCGLDSTPIEFDNEQ